MEGTEVRRAVVTERVGGRLVIVFLTQFPHDNRQQAQLVVAVAYTNPILLCIYYDKLNVVYKQKFNEVELSRLVVDLQGKKNKDVWTRW